MHFGSKTPGIEYYIDNDNERVVLGVTETEKGMGVIINNNFKNKFQAEQGRLQKTFGRRRHGYQIDGEKFGYNPTRNDSF